MFDERGACCLRLALGEDEGQEKIRMLGIVHFSQRLSRRSRGAYENEVCASDMLLKKINFTIFRINID